ncbi:hypothetical protein [Gallibacterium anatis]|uniref:Uncharacterized protein n=1 Tax=Gallibacterium anatis TaxID=750 RepID=A0A921L077_9PAST|nr:hypothetical protein [Gallibacterium anatis]KGQ42640.1 hypothetical protein JP29_12010 [Gallibacterium anatis]KGQ61334.1 hypothetical protein IO43_11030 [Gallibacterium anatis 7990]MDK9429192.1 hypothetical protein [Gallibacterium anatis]WIM78569.1 hypothetical protein QP018_07215 [Gallibacterium anatis]HJF72621.1 hypothetical protein [Gallibacterium anatis]
MKKLLLITLGTTLSFSTLAANLQWNNVEPGYSYQQPTSTTYTQIGNQMIGSDGSSATRIGNQTIYQDSQGNRSTCTQIGNQIICN